MDMVATHEIKLHRRCCDRVCSGDKTAELRYNDRDYQKGDIIRFIPTDDKDMVAANLPRHEIQQKEYRITHVLSHADGLCPGYVVLSIRENK